MSYRHAEYFLVGQTQSLKQKEKMLNINKYDKFINLILTNDKFVNGLLIKQNES